MNNIFKPVSLSNAERMTRAKDIVENVEKISSEITKLDQVDKVDLSSEKGNVVIDHKHLESEHKPQIYIKENPKQQDTDRVLNADVSFDPASKKIGKSEINTENTDDVTNEEVKVSYSKGELVEKDGFLGIFGKPVTRTQYGLFIDDSVGYWQNVKVNKETGEILKYTQGDSL